MSLDILAYEAPLFALLETRDSNQLPERRGRALQALSRLPAAAIERSMDGPLAWALLEVTRIGGVGMSWFQDMPEHEARRLERVRQALANLAQRPADGANVGCLLPDGNSWKPLSVQRARSPMPRAKPLIVHIDQCVHRVDELTLTLQDVADHSTGADIFVVRTRFGKSIRTLTPEWLLGARTALCTAHLKGRHLLPRFAAIGAGMTPPPALRRLPADVRLVVAEDGATLPVDWEVQPTGTASEARARYARGETVCFSVSSFEEAVACLLPFEGCE